MFPGRRLGSFDLLVLWLVFKAIASTVIEDFVKSLNTPAVIIQKTSESVRSFTCYNAEPIIPPQKIIVEEMPADKTVRSFNSAGTSYNLYAIPLTKESGIITAKIAQTCAFPVPFISKGEPYIETGVDKFIVRSSIFGYKTFLDSSIFFQYKQYTEEDIKAVYNTYINFQQYSDASNLYYFCIYCPFRDVTTGSALQYDIEIESRNKKVLASFNDLNALKDGVKLIHVPFEGSFTIKLDLIEEKLSFKLNGTDLPDLAISYAEGSGTPVKVNSDFDLENGINKKIMFENSGLYSQTIRMAVTDLEVSNNAGVIVGSVLGVIGFLIVLGIVIFFVRRFLKNRYPSNYPNGSNANLQSRIGEGQNDHVLLADDFNSVGGRSNFKGGMQQPNDILDIQIIDPRNEQPTDAKAKVPNGEPKKDVPNEISVKVIESGVERIEF